MEIEKKFSVVLYREAQEFLAQLDDKTQPIETLVIATHGFIKKTQKTPQKEIDKAIAIRNIYFENK